MSHANCLTHCSCAEFLHGSCNITFIRLPTLENLERGISVSAAHGHPLQIVKTMPDTKVKQAVYFEKMLAFPLNVRNCGSETVAYTFLSMKKGDANQNFLKMNFTNGS